MLSKLIQKKSYWLFVIVCTFVTLSSSNSVSSANSQHKTPMIIDTDAGWDDWIAISYLIRKEKTSHYTIAGIVSNGIGEAHLKPGAINISKIGALSGRADIPVYYGSDKSLKYHNRFPTQFRNAIDNLHGITLPPIKYSVPRLGGINFIKTYLENSKDKIDLLAIGGLTDLAMVLKTNPKLAEKIHVLTIMGGVFDFARQKNQSPKGNIQNFHPSEYPTNTTAEWNIFIDPVALQLVLDNVKHITIVPLNATKFTTLTKSLVNKLPNKTNLQQFIYNVIKGRYLNAIRHHYTENVYDALAAVISTGDPKISQFIQRDVTVITKSSNKKDRLGTTLWSRGNHNIRIAISADPTVFEKELLNYL